MRMRGDEIIIMTPSDCVGPTVIRTTWDRPFSVCAEGRVPALAVVCGKAAFVFWDWCSYYIREVVCTILIEDGNKLESVSDIQMLPSCHTAEPEMSST
jgi:hypothetical protein